MGLSPAGYLGRILLRLGRVNEWARLPPEPRYCRAGAGSRVTSGSAIGIKADKPFTMDMSVASP